MADDNRFAGIGEQLDEGAEGDNGASQNQETENTETPDSPEQQSDRSTTDSTGEQADEEGPAFSFEATAQTSIYPRTETANDTLDDVEFEVEGILRREYDIRDLAGRELHDAMIQLAAERPDDIAELIVQLRDDCA